MDWFRRQALNLVVWLTFDVLARWGFINAGVWVFQLAIPLGVEETFEPVDWST